MEKRKGYGMERCVDCGFSTDRVNSKNAYKLICTCKGSYKRHGDTCPEYWNREEMKEFIDKTINGSRETEGGKEV